MQYHYVIGYDSELMKWFVESESTAYFPDGNVWSDERSNSPEYGHHGWFVPEENSNSEELDFKLHKILQHSIYSIPVVNL